MKRKDIGDAGYFPLEFQVAGAMWERLELGRVVEELPPGGSQVMVARQLARRLNRLPEMEGKPVPAWLLNLHSIMLRIFRHVIDLYADVRQPGVLDEAPAACGYVYGAGPLGETVGRFALLYPPKAVLAGGETVAGYLAGDSPDRRRKKRIVKELLLLRVAAENRALDPFRILFDDRELALRSPYRKVMADLERELGNAPPDETLGLTLPEILRAPIKASPDSLAGQMEYIRAHWAPILPPELLAEVETAFGIVAEETREWWGGAGPPQVLEFGPKGGFPHPDDHYPEPERFSADIDWMPNVVLIAKMVYVWLGQLSRWYGREITRLDQIPDEELDRLARWGFTGLWLIGIWERSPASQEIKRLSGNQEAISSAYSLFDYRIAADLGGWEALGNLRDRALARGIRLASDMVPNHTGIYSKWTVEHPDWFIQLDHPPYPTYTFDGPDLSFSPEVSLHIEDGYWDKSDAAVVFKHYDHRDGRTRYVYHGNDGTSTPWNDTAQLNYLNPEVREAVIRTILHVAHNFPIIRFDAAMTLAKKHFQRLWFPQPGLGSGVPSRAEHGMSRAAFDAAMPEEFWRQVVDRVAAEVPDTLLLAEAFWLMEGYFVRTLGMHRVYNSAFMNMLKMEENAKYRQTIKNVLEFNPEILKRFVNFMNNPDERTALEQFGKENKYFGAAVLLVTMPGLPMIGHGQIEGFHEKYGMEYKRACWDEPVDEHLVAEHEARIFPLMRRRRLFSGSENFTLYDFYVDGAVDENVFAYSNRLGEDRGLVLYHNRYATTAGWIRTSCARAVRIDSGETVPMQTTLAEALGLNPDGRFYYLFRDYATGLEYVRHGRELCERGMFVELEAYEYHAFLDFREVRDDDFGTWGRLCFGLAGRGVPSMDEEVKLVRYEALVARFGELFSGDPLSLLAAPLGAKREKSLRPLRTRIEAFLDALAGVAGVAGDPAAVADLIMERLEFFAPSAGKGQREAACEPPADLPGRLLLFALLILRETGALEKAKGRVARPAEWFAAYGLRRALVDIFRSAEEESGEAFPHPPETMVLLADILLSHAGFPALLAAGKRNEWVKGLLADSAVRRFLRVHRSGGVEWFVKEPFEELLNWFTLVAVTGPQPSGTDLALVQAELADLKAAAADAGYRADLLLSLSAPAGVPETAGGAEEEGDGVA